MSEVTLSALDRERLAVEANEHWSELITATQDAAKSASLAGLALQQIKDSLPHGQWLDFLAKHCPKIHHRKAQRLIEWANTSQATHLTGEDYHEEYQRIISGRPKPVATETSSADSGMSVVTFNRFTGWIANHVTEEAAAKTVRDLAPEQRQAMRARLETAKVKIGIFEAALNAPEIEA